MMVLAVSSLHAQKFPSTLPNPATPGLALDYQLMHRLFEHTNNTMMVGLGVTTIGGGLMALTLLPEYSRRPAEDEEYSGVGNEGAAIVFALEMVVVYCGVLTCAIGGSENLILRARMNRLLEKNDFLNIPGEDIYSWRAYRRTCVHEASHKWMKVSGITTLGMGAIVCADMISQLAFDSMVFSNAADTAWLIGLASATTFLASGAVNLVTRASVHGQASLQPAIAFQPCTGKPIPGLRLTATF